MNNLIDELIPKKTRTITAHLEKALIALGDNFPHKKEIKRTAERLTSVWIEMSKSSTSSPPKLKWFPTDFRSLMIKGPIESYFLCPHHLLPVTAKTIIGMVPNGYTLGISKISRIVSWACNRFELQEDITKLIADNLWEVQECYKPKGLIVSMIGDHFCEKIRGIKQKSPTQTVEMRGNVTAEELFLFNARINQDQFVIER